MNALSESEISMPTITPHIQQDGEDAVIRITPAEMAAWAKLLSRNVTHSMTVLTPQDREKMNEISSSLSAMLSVHWHKTGTRPID